MSPYEMEKVREEFETACSVLGWVKDYRTVHHEREWDEERTVEWWRSPNSGLLFSEDDLTVGMATEIVLLAQLVKTLRSRVG